MEKYKIKEEEIKKGNEFFGDLYLDNCNVKFQGKNNILFINGKLTLKDSNIEFRGDNSIIYICETDDIITLDVKVYNNSTFYVGENIWINKGIKIVISEETNVFFGRDCLISYDTCIRTGDPHLLYDCNTLERINQSKSVYVGDHVWIGQHAYILKGAKVGSGTTFGAMSLLSGKKYYSNCCYGGNPAKLIKKDVFFIKDDCHRFTKKEKEEYQKYDGKEFIYEVDNNTLSFESIEESLNNLSIKEKLTFLDNITNNQNKNRFCIKE